MMALLLLLLYPFYNTYKLDVLQVCGGLNFSFWQRCRNVFRNIVFIFRKSFGDRKLIAVFIHTCIHGSHFYRLDVLECVSDSRLCAAQHYCLYLLLFSFRL